MRGRRARPRPAHPRGVARVRMPDPREARSASPAPIRACDLACRRQPDSYRATTAWAQPQRFHLRPGSDYEHRAGAQPKHMLRDAPEQQALHARGTLAGDHHDVGCGLLGDPHDVVRNILSVRERFNEESGWWIAEPLKQLARARFLSSRDLLQTLRGGGRGNVESVGVGVQDAENDQFRTGAPPRAQRPWPGPPRSSRSHRMRPATSSVLTPPSPRATAAAPRLLSAQHHADHVAPSMTTPIG